MQHVRNMLAQVTRPAKVLVLAPRQCGLEELAEELATARPAVCVELRYYKKRTETDKQTKTGILRNRLRGAITVRFQTPHATDATMPCDLATSFKFSEILAPYVVRIKYT